VADLVSIRAGVVATVGALRLQLEGVHAETHLVVRLDRVVQVMSRALQTIDHAPALGRVAVPTPVVSADAAATDARTPAPVKPTPPVPPSKE
jgi:hypothetical protein